MVSRGSCGGPLAVSASGVSAVSGVASVTWAVVMGDAVAASVADMYGDETYSSCPLAAAGLSTITPGSAEPWVGDVIDAGNALECGMTLADVAPGAPPVVPDGVVALRSEQDAAAAWARTLES